MKRFYKEAAVDARDHGYAIALDGRPVRTPAKALLLVPSAALADAIAEEWNGLEEEIVPGGMPLMAIACTAIDLVAKDRDRAVGELMDFAGHELLCYRADHPQELIERQEQVWQPLLDWVEGRFGAGLLVGRGILHLEQTAEALVALKAAAESYGDFELAALATAVRACGSLVVGLALTEGRLHADEAFAASELDESFQIELWGEDPIARDRRNGVRRELDTVARFLSALRE